MSGIPVHASFADKRKSPRKLYYPAFIVTGGGPPTRSCILLDVSKAGARLSAETTEDIPDKFVLSLPSDGSVQRLCQVQWRFDNQLGIEFLRGDIGNDLRRGLTLADLDKSDESVRSSSPATWLDC